MWSCEKCGHENSKGDFCDRCGAPCPKQNTSDLRNGELENSPVPLKLKSGKKALILSGAAVIVCGALFVGALYQRLNSGSPDRSAVVSTVSGPAKEVDTSKPIQAAVPAVEAPADGEYPLGSWITLSAPEGYDIYYTLGGEEVEDLDPADFIAYEEPVLMPPYESKMRVWCQGVGEKSEVQSCSYNVYDDDAAKQEFDSDKALQAAIDLAGFIGPFESPEQMDYEQLLTLAMQSAPEAGWQMNGTAGGYVVVTREEINRWLDSYFEGRILPLDPGEGAEGTYEFLADISDAFNESEEYRNFQGLEGPVTDAYYGARENVYRVPRILSLTHGEDGNTELTVAFDTAQGMHATYLGVDTGVGYGIGLRRGPDVTAVADPKFGLTKLDTNGAALTYIDVDALARMNFGVYGKVYRYTFSVKENGEYLPESCVEVPVDSPAYTPQATPSLTSGSVIAPEGRMRLTMDGDWMGEIYYSYDGENYKKYPGILADLPESDFSLYTYVQTGPQDAPVKGRVSVATYETFSMPPELLEQAAVFCQYGDYSGDLDACMDDKSFVRAMVESYLKSGDGWELYYFNFDDEAGDSSLHTFADRYGYSRDEIDESLKSGEISGRVIPAAEMDRYTAQFTCGHRKLNPQACIEDGLFKYVQKYDCYTVNVYGGGSLDPSWLDCRKEGDDITMKTVAVMGAPDDSVSIGLYDEQHGPSIFSEEYEWTEQMMPAEEQGINTDTGRSWYEDWMSLIGAVYAGDAPWREATFTLDNASGRYYLSDLRLPE